VTELGEWLDRLTPEKRALLERQLLQRRARQEPKDRGEEHLGPRGPDDPLVLSFSQQQLWFLQQWNRDGSAYNASLNLRLDGVLDEEALRRSFQTIVDRHETLRTVVVDDDGIPTARLLVDPVFSFHEVDLTGGPPAPDLEIEDAVRTIVRIPFDLSRDLMIRVGLIRLAADARVICMTLHHIACDGWSRGILFDELTALYEGFVTGHPPSLPELPVQYGDFALWQQGWLTGDVLKGEIEFWRDELAGSDFILDLPTDLPRPEVLTFVGGRLGFVIPPEVAEGLRTLGREERATIFMVMHAATGALLHGLTGQEDFLVGSPVGNRRWPETEPLIGFFVNTLLLRLRMTGDPTFRQLVQRCRETAVSCYAHQDIPFERIVQALRPQSTLSGQPPDAGPRAGTADSAGTDCHPCQRGLRIVALRPGPRIRRRPRHTGRLRGVQLRPLPRGHRQLMDVGLRRPPRCGDPKSRPTPVRSGRGRPDAGPTTLRPC
jgi:hypothetical protein